MALKTKFGGCLLALILSASLTSSSVAQRPDPSNRPPQPSTPAPAQHSAPATAPRPTPPSAPRQGSTPPPRQQPSNSPRRDQAPVTRDDRPPTRSGNANSSARNSVHDAVDPNRPPVNHQQWIRIVRRVVSIREMGNIHEAGKTITIPTEITSNGSAPKNNNGCSRISNAFGNCLRNSSRTCVTVNESGSR